MYASSHIATNSFHFQFYIHNASQLTPYHPSSPTSLSPFFPSPLPSPRTLSPIINTVFWQGCKSRFWTFPWLTFLYPNIAISIYTRGQLVLICSIFQSIFTMPVNLPLTFSPLPPLRPFSPYPFPHHQYNFLTGLQESFLKCSLVDNFYYLFSLWNICWWGLEEHWLFLEGKNSWIISE